MQYIHCTSEMSTVTILLLFDHSNSANTPLNVKAFDLTQTHLWEDLKASAHFATEVLEQVTVSSHLQPHQPSTGEATCLYTPSDRLPERHKSLPESHILSWSPCSHSPWVSVILHDALQKQNSLLLLLLVWALAEDTQILLPCHVLPVIYAVHSLPLARTNSGKNYLFPAHKRSCTFKCSSPFTVSSSNSFKTSYSTAFVLCFITTQL